MLLLNKLEALRAEWEQAQNNPKEAETSTLYPSRRERLKTIEAEIALLRLTQAEDRLIVQLVIGILSFVGGSVFTLLFKAILS
jgi:hypothetical protein